MSCDWNRRDCLRWTAGSAVPWLANIGRLLAAEGERSATRAPARSIILLWLAGGPSQLETFDPHPGSRIAGGTGAISTAVKGIKLAEGYPRLAAAMRSVSLIRSMTSTEPDHERGTQLAKTGYTPDAVTVFPSIGAICCHELPAQGADIPRHVSILAGSWPSQGGFLGSEYDAFQTGDPAHPVPDVHTGVSNARYRRRLEDLAVVERAFAARHGLHAETLGHARLADQARRMMSSEQLRAFDVSEEPASLRRAYGETPFGRGCLAARRLTEVGVRAIEVTLSGWDSHVDNHAAHRKLATTLDPAMAALIQDLRERERLDTTLVICAGEFGRTPKINALGGRDHWTAAFSVALAGGAMRGGVVIGQTDPDGGRHVPDPKTFADLHATILKALGINPAKENVSPARRPVKLSEGNVISELLQVA